MLIFNTRYVITEWDGSKADVVVEQHNDKEVFITYEDGVTHKVTYKHFLSLFPQLLQ